MNRRVVVVREIRRALITFEATVLVIAAIKAIWLDYRPETATVLLYGVMLGQLSMIATKPAANLLRDYRRKKR